jgi:hypothetical protein
MAIGCSSNQYRYLLAVQCEGRPIPGQPAGITDVGFAPVEVTIECDDRKTVTQFDPLDFPIKAKTICFGEQSHIFEDIEAGFPRGFTVRAERKGYKPWTATYRNDNYFIRTESGEWFRIDNVVLEPDDSPKPSTRIRGGPDDPGVAKN